MKNLTNIIMRKLTIYLILVSPLLLMINLFGCGKQQTGVIGQEALINLDSRMLFSSYVNVSPGNGMTAEVNPPRFRWFYVLRPGEMPHRIKPNMFRFQVADNRDFNNPIVDVKTDINFYNALAPFPEGETYYWHVGYIPAGQNEPQEWTETYAVEIPAGTPVWDRSVLQNPDFGGHPRLLFRKDELGRLRQMALADSAFQQGIIGAAEQMTRHKWWNNWPETDLGKTEYTYGFYFKLCRELIKTAFAYLITEDEKYARVLSIWKTIASYPKGGASSPEGMGTGADSEDNTSITEYLACVYDWFYDRFTDQEKAVFENSLEWRIREWMYDFQWGGALYTGGSENPVLSRASIAIAGSEHSWEGALDTFPASIVLYEKSETARKYFHWMSNYIISVGELIAQNGGYDDGAAYGQSHMKWLTYQLMYLSSALPALHIGKNPLYTQYAEFFTALVPVGMTYSHFGRISQHGAGIMHRMEVFDLLAYITGNGEILDTWLNGGGLQKQTFSWRPWVHIAAPLRFKNGLDPVSETKTRFIFPATGFVMAHKYPPGSKRAFQDGVGVIFCSRPNPGDEYNNENAFQMYAYGQHLNYGGHSGDENPYGFQTIAHNTILVDGIGQTMTEASRQEGYRAALLAFEKGDDYCYWMGDATNAYPRHTEIARHGGWSSKTLIDYDETLFGERGAPQVERFRRHILFMHDKYLVIFDDLKTSTDHPSKFSWHYRVLPQCSVQVAQGEGLLSYRLDDVNVLIQQVAFPQALEFKDLQGMDQYINPINGNNYLENNKWVSLDLKRRRYREKVCQHNFWFTTKDPYSEFHFLTVVFPVKPGTGDPAISRLDDFTVRVENDGDTDIISFDKNTKFPATLIVDLEAFRQPVHFSE